MPAEKMHSSTLLADLLRGYADVPDVPNSPVSGIASDSRTLDNGYLFLACDGISSHGLDYIEQARAAGVCAVAWDPATASAPSDPGIPMIAVDGLRQHLGGIANRFYGDPSSALGVVGITGTNGKTTVAWIIAQCLQRLEMSCAYSGTLGYGVDELQGADDMTTPAALELHRRLAGFVDHGATHAALEVSSHALSQGRVDGVSFDAVLFTNLTRDHLDYHGDMRAYFESKARLFSGDDSVTKIVNLDSEFGTELAVLCGQDTVAVSTNFDRVANGRPFVFVRSVVAVERGSDIKFASSWGDARFTFPLPGDFNVANAAMVLAYLLSHGVGLGQACEVLEQAEGPPGRMQRVAAGDAAVYVDYAHTPDAIESALRALRPHCRGKLWCVFGCGGDRDVGKRPQMGRLAERFADHVVVTSDNPRSENPQKIIDEIAAGFVQAKSITMIEDRAAAINWVISRAGASDVVLIAGKGHENYQEMGGDRLPFSDYTLALAALVARGVSA